MGRPRHNHWRLGGVVLGACLMFACAEDDTEQEPQFTTDADGCMSNEQFFLKEVWTPILEKQCYNCHNPQGAARDTDMVFQPPGQTGFLEANMSIFADIASFERSGQPLVLAKPQGDFDHGGGVVLSTDSPELGALDEMIRRSKSPVQCREDLSNDDLLEGVDVANGELTLRKASLSLVGRLPTPEEEALIAESGEAALEPILDRMMNEEVFYDRLKEIFNDKFLTDRYLGGNNAVDLLDEGFYPNARWYREDDTGDEDPAFVEAARQYTNNSVAREPLETIVYLVRNDLPFTDLVTADTMVVNPFTAKVYGVEDLEFDDRLDPNEWRPAHVPGVPHAGVLTSPMFLNRFPTTDTNRNRHRARVVYDLFIATNVLSLAERPIDPTSTQHNPTLNDPQCSICHAVVDPVAGAFQNWDARGNFNPPESWYLEMRSPGFGKDAIPAEERLESLNWLGRQLAVDRRFDISIVHTMFEALTGHDPMDLPRTEDSNSYDLELKAYEAQRRFLDTLAAEFRANDHNLKIVIKAIVRSPWYRAAGATGDFDAERALQVAELGTGRLLTPEMLNRKIEAVAGLPWRPNQDSQDYLLDRDDYRMLYGGIDSDDVIERITEPNGIMAAIQTRMANEMACLTTARDFTEEITERRYFTQVEMTYVPEDLQGFEIGQAVEAIKRNIQHLHWHILGERVALNGAEVNATYQLFYDTWKEGQEGLRSEALGARLPNPCQATRDFWTGRDLPEEQRVVDDPDYTVRAWMAVVTYMLSDYRFLHE